MGTPNRFADRPEVVKAALAAALTPHVGMMVAAAGGAASRPGWLDNRGQQVTSQCINNSMLCQHWPTSRSFFLHRVMLCLNAQQWHCLIMAFAAVRGWCCCCCHNMLLLLTLPRLLLLLLLLPQHAGAAVGTARLPLLLLLPGLAAPQQCAGRPDCWATELSARAVP